MYTREVKNTNLNIGIYIPVIQDFFQKNNKRERIKKKITAHSEMESNISERQ